MGSRASFIEVSVLQGQGDKASRPNLVPGPAQTSNEPELQINCSSGLGDFDLISL